MDLSIIIVSWNVKDLLRQCLQSILTQTGDLSYEIIVVDNASTDGSVAMVRSEFPQVKLVASQHNLGFAAGNNLGLKQALGDFLILLNPDTEIKNNALAEMANFLQTNPRVGIVGPQLLNTDGTLQPSIRRYPHLLDQILILTKLPNFFPQLVARYTAQDFNYTKTQPVEQVMGAALMIRREVVTKIGLLDENFRLWFNEIDWCLRCSQAGWKNYYLASAQIIHHKGTGFSQIRALSRQGEWNKALIYYFYKHYALWQTVIIIFFWPLSMGLAVLQQGFGLRSVKPKHL